MLADIRVVMVNPSHSGNIGAAARAMKTMGIAQLVLVGPQQFPDQVALTRSSGAHDLLQQALVVDRLEDALTGAEVVFGSSARARHLPWPLLTPRQMGDTLQTFPKAKVAILFGRENSGLTNEELALCHYHVHIPTDDNFSSLNLAQAIQLLCYEARLAFTKSNNNDVINHEKMATAENTEGLYRHLESTLTSIDFLDPKQPRLLMQRLRRLFNRAHLEETEIHILRGILSRVDRLSTIKSSDSKP